MTTERSGIFAGDDPFVIARRWLGEAEPLEPNDPNAIALATVDGAGMPDVRMVLLKEIESDGAGGGAFVFFTNYNSAKGREIATTGVAAFVLHWKSLRRQIRVRGRVERLDEAASDAYYASRALQSRIGAWASRQSQPLDRVETLQAEVERQRIALGPNPPRPPFWGGFRIIPLEIEFWADGEFRLHDRFQWRRESPPKPVKENDATIFSTSWMITRLNP